MPHGLLSGTEIVQAVENEKKCEQLRARMESSNDPIPWFQYWWHRRKPRIHIDDFDPRPSNAGGGKLNPNSYNLSLHNELVVYTGIEHSPLDMRRNNRTKTLTIPPEGLVLEPGRLYLGRTVEYTRTYNLVPVIDGRSSIGRLGMAVHVTAGYGDNFFCGHWTLEIVVIHPLRIYAGVNIAQVRFHTIGRGFGYQGKYINPRGSLPGASQIWRELCSPVQSNQGSDRPAVQPPDRPV